MTAHGEPRSAGGSTFEQQRRSGDKPLKLRQIPSTDYTSQLQESVAARETVLRRSVLCRSLFLTLLVHMLMFQLPNWFVFK